MPLVKGPLTTLPENTVFNSNTEIFNDLNYEHVAVMARRLWMLLFKENLISRNYIQRV